MNEAESRLLAADWHRREVEYRERLFTEWRDSGLSGRTSRALARAEIEGLDRLKAMNERSILQVEGIGPHGFEEILRMLMDAGYMFAGESSAVLISDMDAVKRLMEMGWTIAPPRRQRI